MWLLSLCVSIGCSCGNKSTAVKKPRPVTSPYLTIPPSPKTEGALVGLAERAKAGDLHAAWQRIHYLVDLFDDARFRRAGDSLPLLAKLANDPRFKAKPRGSAATDRALAFLLREVDVLLLRKRLHAEAQNARTLIEFDNTPLVDRTKVFQRMVELKSIARGGGPLAANAMLRLFGHCRIAMKDATKAHWAKRVATLSHCLYPLYDSDPDPYFAADPNQRPPAPDWKILAARLTGLGESIATSKSRLANAGRNQVNRFKGFLLANTTDLPAAPNPRSYNLPLVDRATFYDWTPILSLGRGDKLKSVADYAKPLRMQVRGDGRFTLAVAVDALGTAAALIRAAEVALHTGAQRMELLVSTKQKLRVPTGDYWHGRISGDTVTRMAVLPLSLATLVRDNIKRGRPEGPRGADWDPARARLELHLVVDRDRWRLLSPQGELANIAVSAHGARPFVKLREQLARIRSAYTEEDSLILVPRQNTTYSTFVSAAAAANKDKNGRPLMLRLGLRTTEPKVTDHLLKRKIERRWRARVTVEPKSLGSRVVAIRTCYQGLLESSPALAGKLYVEQAGDGARITRGPKHPQLRDCVTKSLGTVLKQRKISTATVSFAPR